MRKYIVSILLAMTCLPAMAGNGNTPILVFRAGHTVADDIIWAPSSSIHNPDVAFDFTATNGDMVANHYAKSGDSYSYSPPAPPAPVELGDIAGFKTAVIQDMTLPVAAKLELCKFATLVNELGMLPTTQPMLQVLWAQIVSAEGSGDGPLAGNCTDGTPVVTRIQALAAANHIPLVP